jgi:hypothetical protein
MPFRLFKSVDTFYLGLNALKDRWKTEIYRRGKRARN